MGTCPKCGAEIHEGDAFCHSCGASLTAKIGKPLEKEDHAQEREMCFGERKRPSDYLGLFSFGILILTVGFIFLANPNIISHFSSWIEKMGTQKALSRPPQELIDSAILFFAIIGISNFFIAGVRFMVDKLMRQVLTDTLLGVALVLFSYLIYLYGVHALAWQMVLAAEAVACGILIIIYSVLRFLLPKKLQ